MKHAERLNYLFKVTQVRKGSRTVFPTPRDFGSSSDLHVEASFARDTIRWSIYNLFGKTKAKKYGTLAVTP